MTTQPLKLKKDDVYKESRIKKITILGIFLVVKLSETSVG